MADVQRPGLGLNTVDTRSVEARVGGLRQPGEIDKASLKDRKRLRDRIPTLAQLEALLQEGRLVLPARYFRGYFLDMVV